MNPYETAVGSEFGEFEEIGESSFGEYEFGQGHEAHEQFLGGILGSLLGGEVGGALSEEQEIELASELLEISNEQELEQFLGGLFKKVSQGVGSFIKSPVGRALGGVLKNVAKKALPVVGGALGSMVAPGVGTAIGSKLGSLASGLFEVELEGMPAEHAEYEVARRYVGLAASAARHAALARPRAGVNPVTVARAAVARAARTYAPGLYRQMIRSLMPGGGAARPGVPGQAPVPPVPRPGGVPTIPPRPRPGPLPSRPSFAPAAGVVAPVITPDVAAPAATPMGIPDDAFEPVTTGYDGMPLSGRWVRRGRKIIVLGV